jgi:hypothetical protein
VSAVKGGGAVLEPPSFDGYFGLVRNLHKTAAKAAVFACAGALAIHACSRNLPATDRLGFPSNPNYYPAINPNALGFFINTEEE